MKIKDIRELPEHVKATTTIAVIALLISVTALIVAAGRNGAR